MTLNCKNCLVQLDDDLDKRTDKNIWSTSLFCSIDFQGIIWNKPRERDKCVSIRKRHIKSSTSLPSQTPRPTIAFTPHTFDSNKVDKSPCRNANHGILYTHPTIVQFGLSEERFGILPFPWGFFFTFTAA